MTNAIDRLGIRLAKQAETDDDLAYDLKALSYLHSAAVQICDNLKGAGAGRDPDVVRLSQALLEVDEKPKTMNVEVRINFRGSDADAVVRLGEIFKEHEDELDAYVNDYEEVE